jgi:hypothetical protein
MELRVTRREAEEKQPEMGFKEMGFHTLIKQPEPSGT